MNDMKCCSCACCKGSLEAQLTSLCINGSGNEEPIERVVEQSHQRSPDLYSPAPRTSSSRPSLFTGEGIENDDSGFVDEFHGYGPDESEEVDQLRTLDQPPEPSANSSDFKAVGGDYWFRADSQPDRIDYCDEDSFSSSDTCLCGQCGKSTTSPPPSSSTSSYEGTEAEKDEICAKNNLNWPSHDYQEEQEVQEDVGTSFNSLLHQSSHTLRTLDYELYKCVMRMQEALDTAHRAVRKLHNAQSMVNDLERDLNASLDQVSTSLSHASAIKSKQAEVGEKGTSHYNGM